MQYTRKSDGATVDARPVKSTAYNPTRHQAAKPGEKNTWSAVDEEIEGIGKVPVGHMVVTDENGKITCPSDAAFKELYEPAVAATKPAVPAKSGEGN